MCPSFGLRVGSVTARSRLLHLFLYLFRISHHGKVKEMGERREYNQAFIPTPHQTLGLATSVCVCLLAPRRTQSPRLYDRTKQVPLLASPVPAVRTWVGRLSCQVRNFFSRRVCQGHVLPVAFTTKPGTPERAIHVPSASVPMVQPHGWQTGWAQGSASV